ncbi:MAG TPA: lytic transglycosylase domain-containing protein [Hanamia sp.]|nr:lytic transglycosylase domain-containing protein [Hanamia sp.]
MKSIQSKSLLSLIIIFFIIGFSTSAKNLFGFPAEINSTDSLSPIADAVISANVHIQRTLIRNPHWVVYPEILVEHRNESKEYVKHYARHEREYIIHMFHKGKDFFPKAKSIFDKYGVPDVLEMLPALESNFNANAVSSVGAVGYWQFMSELAGDYGLKTKGKYDERKNFTKSTIAAAKYFRDQIKYFNGDLLLAVASYNCGVGRVEVDMKKSRTPNADFWDIKKYLPTETQLFVMRFIALNVIAANYHNFLKGNLNFNESPLIQLATFDSSSQDNSVSHNSL